MQASGLNLDGIFKNGGAGLKDLVPGSISATGEAETVGSDDSAVLEDDVVAELAVLADDGVRVGNEVIASADVRIDDDVREDDGVVADGYVVSDDNIGSDVGVGADLGRGGDDGGGVDAGAIGRRLVEELDGASEGEVGVIDTKRGCGDGGEPGFDQHGGGFGRAGESSVFGVGDKGQVAGGRRCRYRRLL